MKPLMKAIVLTLTCLLPASGVLAVAGQTQEAAGAGQGQTSPPANTGESGQFPSWRNPGPQPDNRTKLERLDRLLIAMVENRNNEASETVARLRAPNRTIRSERRQAEETTLGLRVQIELQRKFRTETEALDAWLKLRSEAAEAEGVSPDEYDTHAIRMAHFNNAHEIWQEGQGWKVRSRWFVLFPPREWPDGREKAEEARVHLGIYMRAMAADLGFTEADVTVTLVPEAGWM